MTDIIGIDISHWQGQLSNEAISKILALGVRFAGVKFSQGTSYRDDCAVYNASQLQVAGVKVFPYHFVTTDNGIQQYNNFVESMAGFQFDLPPALDCEYYNQVSGNAYRGPVIFTGMFGLTITTAAIVDVIGMRLTEWMKSQTKLTTYQYPTIYTNVSSGNKIFTSAYSKMNRYNLWVANWKVAKPNLPAIWKDKGYLIWQDGVVDGSPYGIAGDVDHNVWGNLFPFPDNPPPPDPEPEPNPEADYYDMTLKSKSGKSYAGRITEVT